jgi:hypothetical protein
MSRACTYRTKIDLDKVLPNERQPRLGSKVDEELQRQIEANEGLFEPLLVDTSRLQQRCELPDSTLLTLGSEPVLRGELVEAGLLPKETF